MPKDTREALARLEAELRNAADGAAPSPTTHHRLKVYNTDTTDEDLDAYSEAVRVPPRKHRLLKFLLILCLIAGILAYLAWKAALL